MFLLYSWYFLQHGEMNKIFSACCNMSISAEWFLRIMRLVWSRQPRNLPLFLLSQLWGTYILLCFSLPSVLKEAPGSGERNGLERPINLEGTWACKPRAQEPDSLISTLSIHIHSCLCLGQSPLTYSPGECIQRDLYLPLTYDPFIPHSSPINN